VRQAKLANINSEEFRNCIRYVASSVSVVAVSIDGEPQGMLATSICSVTTEPPTILASINRSASIHDQIAKDGRFCTSILSKTQLDAARTFSERDGSERFADCKWDTLTTGAPAIIGALSNIDTEVEAQIPVGTHTLFIGRVVALRGGSDVDDLGPLIYCDRTYGSVCKIPHPTVC